MVINKHGMNNKVIFVLFAFDVAPDIELVAGLTAVWCVMTKGGGKL